MTRDGEARPFRAFLAVDLDAGARAWAGAVAEALRARPGGEGVRWVRPENYHVTVRFLGGVAPERVPALCAGVARALAGRGGFALSLGAPHAFPSPHRPRVVALPLAPPAPLVELAESVEKGVAAAGFPRESRLFRAHLTLGRVRQPGRAPELAGVPVADPPRFPVCELVLYRSELSPRGSTYTPVERFPLGASDHPGTPNSED